MRKELAEHNLGWRGGKRLVTEVERGWPKVTGWVPWLGDFTHVCQEAEHP